MPERQAEQAADQPPVPVEYLDAVGVPERMQSSAFARSDTTLQLSWVIGGFVGIAMPLMPRLGLSVACGVLGAWAVFVLVTRPGRSRSGVPAT